MKRRKTIYGVLLIAAMILGGCASNKKKKCDTCPKWTSGVVTEASQIADLA